MSEVCSKNVNVLLLLTGGKKNTLAGYPTVAVNHYVLNE